jgi:hypothetical protein
MSTDGQPQKTSRALIAVMAVAVVAALLAGYMMAAEPDAAPNAPQGVAGFVKTCVMPDEPSDARCKNKADILSAWGVDVDDLIEQRRLLMVSTVKRMLSGELSRHNLYESCIHQGACAPVPLLPDTVDPAAIASGNSYLATRKAFWQLAENSPLTPEICLFMDICRAMQAAGVITVP